MNIHMAYKAKSKLQVCTTLALCCEKYYQVYTHKCPNLQSRMLLTAAFYKNIALGLPTKAQVWKEPSIFPLAQSLMKIL